MKIALGAALLAAVALTASACGSSHPKAGASTASSSRLVLGGAVRCTATVKTPAHVGDELGVSVRFENLSHQPVKVSPGYRGVWVVVKSSDGTTYDTRVPWENTRGLPTPPIALAPGAAKTVPLRGLRVRWDGPLRITPGCGTSASGPIVADVTSPGLPPSATAALKIVVAATGGLLDHCRPRTPGISVIGRIDPPSGDAPALAARCSIDLHPEHGFYHAQVLVLTPPDLSGAKVEAPYEALTVPYHRNGNQQALAWEFVVTREGATSVASAEQETTRPGAGMAQTWLWTSAGPKPGGSGQCGSSGGGFGPDGPSVSFISVCR